MKQLTVVIIGVLFFILIMISIGLWLRIGQEITPGCYLLGDATIVC